MRLSELVKFHRDHQETYNKASSLRSFDHSARVLVRLMGGNLEVESLTQLDIQRFVSARRQEAKPISVNKDLRHLKAMLNWAEDTGLLPELPKVKIRQLKTPRKRELRPLTREEILKLIRHAPGRYKLLIHLGATTGARLGELLNLQWRDIEVDRKLLLIRRDTKNHQERAIPISDKTVAMLQQIREFSPYAGDEDFLICSRKGTPIQKNNAGAKLKKIFVEAGIHIPGAPTSHWLRHTAASQMLANGADIETVRELMGHRDISTTALYAHSSADLKRKAISGLEI